MSEYQVPLPQVLTLVSALCAAVITLFWLLVKTYEKMLKQQGEFADRHAEMVEEQIKNNSATSRQIERSTDALNNLARLVERLTGGGGGGTTSGIF